MRGEFLARGSVARLPGVGRCGIRVGWVTRIYHRHGQGIPAEYSVRVVAGRANRLGAGSSDKKPTTPARAGSHVGRSALLCPRISLHLSDISRRQPAVGNTGGVCVDAAEALLTLLATESVVD